jgi:hypothetical protein
MKATCFHGLEMKAGYAYDYGQGCDEHAKDHRDSSV